MSQNMPSDALCGPWAASQAPVCTCARRAPNAPARRPEPAIVIRTIEGRTPTPPMTPERYAEQVATLARAGIHVPPGVMP